MKYKMINEFETIYDERHQHSVEWAFKHAKGQLERYQEKTGKKLSRYFSRFVTVSNGFTVLEFLISMLLVMVVSELMHNSVSLIHSRTYTTWVFLTFAFIKVFLENYFVRPTMEKIGWRLFRKSTIQLKNVIIDQD
jgi:hypothetical protein